MNLENPLPAANRECMELAGTSVDARPGPAFVESELRRLARELSGELPAPKLIATLGYTLLSSRGNEILAELLRPCGALSIGAGRGYTESLLRDAGIDVVVTDPCPTAGAFTAVDPVPWQAVAHEHPERALLLLHPDRRGAPPHDGPMASGAARAYLGAGGHTIVYVGERHAGNPFGTDPEFYALLEGLAREPGWKVKEFARVTPDLSYIRMHTVICVASRHPEVRARADSILRD